jgi:hypothetical protein
MDFTVDAAEVGKGESEIHLDATGTVKVTLNAAAYLPETPNNAIRKLPYDEKPYWDVERARIGDSLLKIEEGKINDTRLYRCLDRLLPHKRNWSGI